ncbi:MAG: phosphoribosyltransferase [Bacteroidia bacterium]
MYYQNRTEAGKILAAALEKFRDADAVVLAVPRGGIPVACYVARQLQKPVGLLMTKKIGHPLYPEYAIGAVSLNDYSTDANYNISKQWLDDTVRTIRDSLEKRYRHLMGDHAPPEIKDKTVIIVDDGIATGKTILSSIPMLKKSQPEKIVVATPVAPKEAKDLFKGIADEFICTYTPVDFYGVGLHYYDFTQVSDAEAERLLKDCNINEKS